MYLQCGITTCSQQGLVSGYLHDYSFHSVALLQSGCHGSSLQRQYRQKLVQNREAGT